MAIAGSPAIAFEMARTLQTSFQYYRRSQLQALSLSAKVRALGKLIKDNLPMTLQGVGVVVPDPRRARSACINPTRSLYFYDALGAQFQAVDFAVSGSGSPAVRSVLQWINRWSGQPTVAARRKAGRATRAAIARRRRRIGHRDRRRRPPLAYFPAGETAHPRRPALRHARDAARMLYRARSSHL